MVIITRKLWPWALLILIKAQLFLYFKVTGTSSCYLGNDLDTKFNVSESIIFKEGFYLLKDQIPCDGRITSIELCGAFISSDSIASDVTVVYLNASLYRNETNLLKRVTELVRLESRSSATFTRNGVTCARISIIEYNWTAVRGDIFGVGFVNSSCEVLLTFGSSTFQTCPAYAAVYTNSSSDMVYVPENNSNIQLNELSNVTNLKVNLQVSVEPLPPLYSDTCSDSESDPSRSEPVITAPSETQIFTGSGTYIMNDVLECTGYVTSVSFCGVLVNEREPFPQQSVYRFTLLHLRLWGDRYDVINRGIVDYEVADAAKTTETTFNPTCQSHDLSGWLVLQGDQLGVTLYAHCEHSRLSRDNTYYCPIQIGLINTGCRDSSLFVTDTFEELSSSVSVASDSIKKSNTSMVAIKLNLDINYDIVYECLGQDQTPLNLRIIYGISLSFLLLMISIIACSIIIVYRVKTKRKVVSNDAAILTPDDQLILQYNTCYCNSPFGSKMEQRNATLIESTHSYVISSLGLSCAESDEEQYQQPASKEEDLKYQLKNLKVDEILKDKIELKEYLGSGRFGVVYRGLLTVTGADSEGGVKEVAVKTMENGASEEDRVKFLQEAVIMGQFNNLYIVRIFGVLTSDNQPYMIICEFMSKGDLHRHLHNIKIKGTLNQSEAGAMLLSYSRQVASAMVYLSGKGYVHCDLAARNILLSEDGVCKISDFGLSRNLQDEDYYVAKSGVIPLRWTAPEAFQDGKFSTASDVWSYGVVLYEIWSLACKPYRNLTNEQILIKMLEGHRLPSPPGCPRAIYNKMISCWHPDTSSRSTFISVQISLQQPDYELLKWSEEDKATYSENARTIGATFQDGESLFTDMQTMYEVV